MTEHADPVESSSPDVAAAQDELNDAIAELVSRVKPATLARHAKEDARTAVSDTANFLKGDGLPADSPRRRRNTIVALAAAGLAVTITATKILKKARS